MDEQARLAEEIKAEYGVDLREIRVPELTSELDSLLSVWGMIFLLVLAAIFVLVVSWAVSFALFLGKVSWLSISFILVYATIASLAFWTLLSFLLLARRLLNNISIIFTVFLDTVETIAARVNPPNARGYNKPPVASYLQLLRGSMYFVILPAIAQFVRNKLYILSRPVVWLMERIVFDTISLVVTRVERLGIDSASENSGERDPSQTEPTPIYGHRIADISGRIRGSVGDAHYVAKRRILFPFQVAVLASFVVLYAPIAVIYWVVAL